MADKKSEALKVAIPAILARTPPKGVSPARKRFAIAIAGASDIAQWFVLPATVEGGVSPVEVGIDAATALAILLVVGFHWRLAIALFAELVPGLDLAPTWTAVVLSLPTETPALTAPAPKAEPPSPE
ncbi:MAG: hypothetical protein ACRELY_16330 [Polyangiaceae bacterium]